MFTLVLSLALYLILQAQSGRAFSKVCVNLPWSCALDWVFISTSYTVFGLWQGTVVKLILKSPPLRCLLNFYHPICLWYLLSVNSGFFFLKKNLFASNLCIHLLAYSSNPLFLVYFSSLKYWFKWARPFRSAAEFPALRTGVPSEPRVWSSPLCSTPASVLSINTTYTGKVRAAAQPRGPPEVTHNGSNPQPRNSSQKTWAHSLDFGAHNKQWP